mmetsp:Transcript_1647/g.1454  ORF Transcript_1647/g.1454 Transcript_1647/m.1454 type:complete len:120 (-) Transcript_1647:421-780(-)
MNPKSLMVPNEHLKDDYKGISSYHSADIKNNSFITHKKIYPIHPPDESLFENLSWIIESSVEEESLSKNSHLTSKTYTDYSFSIPSGPDIKSSYGLITKIEEMLFIIMRVQPKFKFTYK